MRWSLVLREIRRSAPVGEVPSRKLTIYSPAAMVGYFDELERAASLSEQLDDASLIAMAARYHMHVLGPVPEGYS